jgi:hypothetical protein
MQYCPKCLAEGQEPYFRRTWRVGYYTFCPEHLVMLHDACPECGAPVALHRRDIGKGIDESMALSNCHVCQYDYRAGPFSRPLCNDVGCFDHHCDLLRELHRSDASQLIFDIGYVSVLHQLCKVIMSRSNGGSLHRYLARMMGLEASDIQRGRVTLEARRVAERHQVVTSALWVLMLPEERLRKAWEEKVVRYNHLVKDFRALPHWYRNLTFKLKIRCNTV